MRARTKILIVSESPILPTGMGEVIRLVFGTLLDKYPGHYELHQVALYHSYSVALPRWPVHPTKGAKDKNGVPLFLIADANGELTFREVLPKVQPDIVFAFNDSQRVLHLCAPPEARLYKLVLYLNFDGFPFPPDQGPILSQADLVVTKSDFSRRVALASMPALDGSKVRYLYSPADTLRFVPIGEAEKAALRKKSFPEWMPGDAFVLGWVGRNQWRKQVWVAYEVIHHIRRGDYLVCHDCGRVTLPSRLPPRMRSHGCSASNGAGAPDPQTGTCSHCGRRSVTQAEPMSDVFLWLHMPEDRYQQAWDRSWLEREFGLRPGYDIHYTDGHRLGAFKKPSEMPALYQLWDCLLFLSGGEGFGIPPWEAMCCGLPVIYTHYSSHAEFLDRAEAGLAVGGILQPEKGTSIWRMVADMPKAIEAVRRLYFDRDLAKALGANGRGFVGQHSVDLQAQRWHRLFQSLLARESATPSPSRESADNLNRDANLQLAVE